MTEWNEEHHSIDQLITRAFPDDVPSEARARLGARLKAFEQKLDEREALRTGTVSPLTLNSIQLWFHSVMGKIVFTTASIGFILLTFVIHELKPKSAFACVIESVHAAAESIAAVRNVNSMQCDIHSNDSQSPSAGFTVWWDRSGRIRLEYRKNGEEIDEVWWMEDERLTLLARKGPDEEQPDMGLSLLDPVLKTVLSTASPKRLTEWMMGPWNETKRRIQDERDAIQYTISAGVGKPEREIWIDGASKLPVKLKVFVGCASLLAHPASFLFQWNVEFEPEIMRIPHSAK